MGVDFLTCHFCGRTFADCGDYESCECGEHWCSLDCANEDGLKEESCKKGYDVNNNVCEIGCWRCNNHIERTCNYCREEDFEDVILLNFALEKLDITRKELIIQYKETVVLA